MSVQARAPNGAHCRNLQRDRGLGQYWEQAFGRMALQQGRSFTPHQWRRAESAVAHSLDRSKPDGQRYKSYTLPDITIWSAPGEHHEIKHKNATAAGLFGLERYRFEALLWFARETQQSVYYTIHDHGFTDGPDDKANDINHWLTANVLALDRAQRKEADGYSYIDGVRRLTPILYWSRNNWDSLGALWRLIPPSAWAA